MKKLLLTIMAALSILFAQAQCQADFSYMQNGPTTIFADLSTINSGWSTNYSVTWDWDLGDGNASTQQNPTHTYANNGIYWVCLIVTYFDSTTINSCTSFYCDSILVGNSIPASWDCNPASGCYDPFTGLGQYTSLAACQAVCGNPTPSWDCPVNMPGGCYDPGTGLGQYSSLAACQAACVTPTPSWDCDPSGVIGCFDPGTGTGQYSSLAACQAACSTTFNLLCDSITVSGSQTQLTMQLNNLNFIIDYWISTAPDGTVLGEDSMWNSHLVFNSIPHDTIYTCINYNPNGNSLITCCVTWIWDASLGIWAKMGSMTSVADIGSFDKKLIKVVDVLGRENRGDKNKPLFYIYDDGTTEKKIILE